MKMSLTKDKILKTAIMLFSDKGYDKVSMRDIAAEVGIKAASIYNHFSSKHDILRRIYQFYAEQQRMAAPPLEKLLRMAETEHPYKTLMELNYQYPPEAEQMMEQALIISSKHINGDDDGESERFIRNYLFDTFMELVVPVLKRMIELGKIEPLNVESFAYILTYYSLGAAVLNPTNMKISPETRTNVMTLLFSLVKPVNASEMYAQA